MSKSETYEIEVPLLKIIILGDSGVGKTSVMRAFLAEEFVESHLSTIGVDFRVKLLEVDGDMYKLQIMDTAGKPENNLDTLHSYYQTANAFIIVYDVTDNCINAREKIRKARDKVLDEGFSLDAYLWVIAGNKIENSESRKISVEEGKAMALDFAAHFFEISAKNNKYIEDLFQLTVKWCNEKVKDDYENNAKKIIENNSKKREDKKECCNIC